MAIDASKLKRGNKLGAPPSDANPQLAEEAEEPQAPAQVISSTGEQAANRSPAPAAPAIPPAEKVEQQPAQTPAAKDDADTGKSRSRKGDAWGMPRPGEPIAKLGIDLTPDARRRFKAKAAGEGRDGADLVRDWIRQYLGDE